MNQKFEDLKKLKTRTELKVSDLMIGVQTNMG